MTTSAANLLKSLYGEADSLRWIPRLRETLDRWRSLASVQAHAPPAALSERDCLLITYADQVSEPGVPPLRTLAEFAERHLQGVVSGIHVLPFYPWSSDDGFSVKDYFAVDPAYGTWDDVRVLGRKFDLMFDGVFNHLSAQSEWFARFLAGDPQFQDFFVTVEGHPNLSQVIRPRALPLLTRFQSQTGPRDVWTTFSADQVDLNFRNPEVLFAILEAISFYVRQGARFIRLDAIAFLWKEIGTTCLHLPQTHQVIQLLRAVLSEIAPDVRLITETNVPHADNISYFGDGTNETHLVYNFALPPLVLHSFATGDARHLTHWAKSLSLPSSEVAYFNFLASHDGIGLNPARGILNDAEIATLVSRTVTHGGFISYKHQPDGSKAPYEMNINFFDALSNPAADEPLETTVDRSLCAHAILLALRGLPGVYFHSLFGSRGDRKGAEASGIPRRINREKLTRESLELKLADSTSRRHRVFSGLRSLLHTRARNAAFAPSAGQKILDFGEQVFAVERSSDSGNSRVLCLHNVSHHPVTVTLPGSTRTTTLRAYEYRWIELSPIRP